MPVRPAPGLSPAARVAKRALDVAASVVLLLVATPLLAALAVLLRGSGEGHVLVHDLRYAPDGRSLRLLRFDSGGQTAVRRFVRHGSLEHLPRLVDVLRGRLTLVGPPAGRQAGGASRLQAGLAGPWQAGHGADWPDARYLTGWTPLRDVALLVRSALR